VSTVTVAYDCELKRPGCVLIQAAFGCTIDNLDLDRIGHWLLSPTPAMQVYEIPRDRIDDLVHVTQEHNGRD
jgi:hypothetical protein